MKRARPKNKKAAMKRLREQEAALRRETAEAAGSAVFAEKSSETKAKTAKKGKKLPKILLGIFIGIIVLFFTAMGFGLFDESQILTPLEDGKVNVLLLGVDEEGLRTDAIMVASYDVNENQVNMLSIPRDTKIYLSNRKMTRKINEIHAISSKTEKGEILGAEATAEVVTQLTGIPINYYAEFSFSAIDRIFEILGPVTFDVPDVEGGGNGMNYDDPVQNLSIHLQPGVQELSGNQVQQFLRYRKSNSGKGDGSDTSRVARQQEFLKAVVDQKAKNPAILLKLPNLVNQLSKEIVTNITAGDVTKYILRLKRLNGESVQTHSLPGDTKTISGGSYFVCNLDETKTLMTEVFGIPSETAANLTDKVTVSDTHSQSILKAGNIGKKSSNRKTETDDSEKKTTASPSPAPAASPSAEPTKAPVVTKSPTNSPAPTKSPSKSPEQTKVPLEDLDDDYTVID